MPPFLTDVLGAASLVPYGYCLLWRPDLVALHAISDLVMAVAYIAIPVAILIFVHRSRDLDPTRRRIGWLFAAFIGASALAHLGDFLTLWFPWYAAAGIVKAATALLSLAAAAALWIALPRLLRLPSPAELAAANSRLEADASERRLLVERLTALNADLESRVEARTRELSAATKRFELALEGSPITVYTTDRDLRYSWMCNPPHGMKVDDFIGFTDTESLPDLTSTIINPVKRTVLETGVPETVEASLRIGEKIHWYDLRVEPLYEDGAISGLVCVAIDVTAHKEHQRQLKVMMRELTHRSKNLLAVVQGIARQTARTVDDVGTFVIRFSARLRALAGSLDLLVDSGWHGASLRELVDTQLGHVIEGSGERVVIEGENALLSPEAAQNVGLALHELATNASKYGALSVPAGRVRVAWQRITDGERPLFEVVWQEEHGPTVIDLGRKGFGRVMLERLVPRAVDGTADLDLLPGGLEWRLRFPLTQLAPEETV
ncbi:Two-component sensor histidine kinase, contains HisKA and HATPase domains [Pseudoxanthobacter soli DSM 19599]|uniref:histidine kinase n=1 Tax=Pseudoxanthobacter soli DSM 19599 TaxID=1123029 RepID=A0A1M7ZQV5_9HYPH|nr:PAS domain-containing sensor histidine kinase [Pseudoxanthobacter soli]SHO67284.1 Two-component sensor histidine kinase, contains HisKA and HATPase domains [Pseudoxanthobacter soli DSM 19599]